MRTSCWFIALFIPFLPLTYNKNTLGIFGIISMGMLYILSWYVASAAATYPWNFIHLDLDGWILGVGELLLSQEPPPWLGILAKSSLLSECVNKVCVRWRLHVLVIYLEFFSPYTLGFSRGGMRDILSHCVHLKRKLELLHGFDSLPSLWKFVFYVCLCNVLVLFISGVWATITSTLQLRPSPGGRSVATF